MTILGVIVRTLVTGLMFAIFVPLIRRRPKSVSVASAAATAVLALAVVWLVNIEGASRLVVMGFEIDRSVASAEALLEKMDALKEDVRVTTDELDDRVSDARRLLASLEEEIGTVGSTIRSLEIRSRLQFSANWTEDSVFEGARATLAGTALTAQ